MILENKLNITDQAELAREEERISKTRAKAMFESRYLNSLPREAIKVICEVFNCNLDEILNVKELKKGMSNKSFSFCIKDNKYIIRVPGVGTDKLINREQEINVYNIIKDLNITEDIIYLNSSNGYKISKYINNIDDIDKYNDNDLEKILTKLREFHNMKLIVDHEFDVWDKIDFYEKLWNGTKSIYKDYENTKKQILTLRNFVEKNAKDKVLSHIDSVLDNFLIINKNKEDEDVKMIDWEYAGMHDPDIDIAMFCIYSIYDRNYIDKIINIYYEDNCSKVTRYKIYCYIAICGLLWSNWCEYKKQLGVNIGEYSKKQYEYAKDFYKIFKDEYEGKDV